MDKKSQWILSLLLLTAILCLVAFGGPWLSKKVFESEKKIIDKNGVTVKAVISDKRQSKGHLVYFTYVYKSSIYTNREQDGGYYETANIGDSIDIKIDTTDPGKSYILR